VICCLSLKMFLNWHPCCDGCVGWRSLAMLSAVVWLVTVNVNLEYLQIRRSLVSVDSVTAGGAFNRNCSSASEIVPTYSWCLNPKSGGKKTLSICLCLLKFWMLSSAAAVTSQFVLLINCYWAFLIKSNFVVGTKQAIKGRCPLCCRRCSRQWESWIPNRICRSCPKCSRSCLVALVIRLEQVRKWASKWINQQRNGCDTSWTEVENSPEKLLSSSFLILLHNSCLL